MKSILKKLTALFSITVITACSSEAPSPGASVVPNSGLLGSYATRVESTVIPHFREKNLADAVEQYVSQGAESGGARRIIEDEEDVYSKQTIDAFTDFYGEDYTIKGEPCVMLLTKKLWSCAQVVGKYLYIIEGRLDYGSAKSEDSGGNEVIIDKTGKKVYPGDTVIINAEARESKLEITACTNSSEWGYFGAVTDPSYGVISKSTADFPGGSDGSHCGNVGEDNVDGIKIERNSDTIFMARLAMFDTLDVEKVVCEGADCTLAALGLADQTK